MKKLFVLLAAIALLTTGAAQAGVIIDSFTDYMTPVIAPAADLDGYGWEIQATTEGQTYVETGLAGVVGGTRKSVLWSNRTTPSTSTSASVYVDPLYAGFTGCNGATTWSTVSLIYNGGGAGLNLNASQGTRFWSDMYFDHLGNGRTSILSMTLVDGQAHTQTVSRTWSTYTSPGDDFVTYGFLFSEFTNINFAEIDSITMSYSSDNGNDYMFGAINSDIPVPEPSSIIALLGGLGSLLAFRRRKA